MIRRSTLSGFTMPESMRKLIVSLFADDTCVFLSEHDDPAALKSILDTWCLASGAKFNITKTEVIPVGTEEHRTRLATTRKLNANALPFEQGIKIASQGEMTRLLGAYIGNGIDTQAPWQPAITSLRNTLQRWNQRPLSMTGKSIIAQAIVAGKMQYLGTVQGVPDDVQKEITGLVQDFLW
ncbi:hypothetical protein AURDEDRAFT_36112, partial [Auricularia subglabra TFB-10046 SS5]